MSICNNHAPLREYRIKNVYKPWFSKEIQKLIYERNHVHKLYIRSKDATLFQKYKTLRNLITSTIGKQKQFYYTEQIKMNTSNKKGMWNVLKHILPSRNDNSNIDEAIDSNNFNEFFSETGIKLTNVFGKLKLPASDINTSNNKLDFHEINVNYILKNF